MAPGLSNPNTWQHSELKTMKTLRKINSDRGYNDPKIRHHKIQIPKLGEMYVAEVDVYLQWRIMRTVQGEPQKTIKAASLNVAEKAIAYLTYMLHQEKELDKDKILSPLQNEQRVMDMYSGDRSPKSPTIAVTEHKKGEAKMTSFIQEKAVQTVQDRNKQTQSSEGNPRQLRSQFNHLSPAKKLPKSVVICRDFYYEPRTSRDFRPPRYEKTSKSQHKD